MIPQWLHDIASVCSIGVVGISIWVFIRDRVRKKRQEAAEQLARHEENLETLNNWMRVISTTVPSRADAFYFLTAQLDQLRWWITEQRIALREHTIGHAALLFLYLLFLLTQVVLDEGFSAWVLLHAANTLWVAVMLYQGRSWRTSMLATLTITESQYAKAMFDMTSKAAQNALERQVKRKGRGGTAGGSNNDAI